MKIIIDFSWFFPFFNSNFFVGLSTFITGLAAFGVYLWQKQDRKVNAARIILSEIKTAETKIDQVKKRLSGTTYDDFPSILTANSWVDSSYLFAKDFDQDELEKINNFFSNCVSIEELAKKDNNFFWVTTEERARVVQQQLPQIIAAAFDPTTNQIDQNKLNTLKQKFLDTISNEPYLYVPKKTVNAIQLIINNLTKITDTPIGEKFKKLSK